MKSFFWVRGLLVLLLATHAFAADWSAPVAELAKEIARRAGPGTITLSVANASSVPADQASKIQTELDAQLRASGVRVVSSAPTDVRITLSENLQGLLWVAVLKRGDSTQVAMFSVPNLPSTEPVKTGPSVVISKSLLWSQPTQILDAVVMENGRRLVVLDANAVSSFAIVNGKWERQQHWAIVHGHTFPRDLRGFLVPTGSGIEMYLPGTICTVSFGQSSAVICRDGDDAWKLGPSAAFFNSARNYFTGAMVPPSNNAVGPFYSVAWLPGAYGQRTVLAGIDGRVHLVGGGPERILPPTTTSDWGSDVAAMKSGCGSGTQLLVTSSGDDTQIDSVRAFEVGDRDANLVSAPLEFAGPITALWSHGDSVTGVAKNLRTGQYEAYSVSATCNR